MLASPSSSLYMGAFTYTRNKVYSFCTTRIQIQCYHRKILCVSVISCKLHGGMRPLNVNYLYYSQNRELKGGVLPVAGRCFKELRFEYVYKEN